MFSNVVETGLPAEAESKQDGLVMFQRTQLVVWQPPLVCYPAATCGEWLSLLSLLPHAFPTSLATTKHSVSHASLRTVGSARADHRQRITKPLCHATFRKPLPPLGLQQGATPAGSHGCKRNRCQRADPRKRTDGGTHHGLHIGLEYVHLRDSIRMATCLPNISGPLTGPSTIHLCPCLPHSPPELFFKGAPLEPIAEYMYHLHKGAASRPELHSSINMTCFHQTVSSACCVM